MLEELLIHFLAHLAVFLCLDLFDLPIINSILIIHKILKSIMSHNQIVLVGDVLTLLRLLLTLDLVGGRGWRRKVRVRGLLAGDCGEAFCLCKALLLVVFILQSMVALGAADYGRVDTRCKVLVLCRLYHLLLEFIQLAKVFLANVRSAHSVMLIDVEVVELARRVGAHKMVRWWDLLVAVSHVRRKVIVLLDLTVTVPVVVAPLLMRAAVRDDLVTSRNSMPRGSCVVMR